MGIRLREHISSKALIRYDKHIFLDIPCTFREENKDMAQTRKLDGFSKGFQNLQNKCSGWKLCLLGFGRGFKIKKKGKKKMCLMVDSEIDMQMVDSENE